MAHLCGVGEVLLNHDLRRNSYTEVIMPKDTVPIYCLSRGFLREVIPKMRLKKLTLLSLLHCV